jgi:hypothetical protein
MNKVNYSKIFKTIPISIIIVIFIILLNSVGKTCPLPIQVIFILSVLISLLVTLFFSYLGGYEFVKLNFNIPKLLFESKIAGEISGHFAIFFLFLIVCLSIFKVFPTSCPPPPPDITGIVKNIETKEVLNDVEVNSINGYVSPIGTKTDALGQFSFKVGEYETVLDKNLEIVFSKNGFREKSVSKNIKDWVKQPQPHLIELNPITITDPTRKITGIVENIKTKEVLNDVEVNASNDYVSPFGTKTDTLGQFSFKVGEYETILDENLRIVFSKNDFFTQPVSKKIKDWVKQKPNLIELTPKNPFKCESFIKEINLKIINELQKQSYTQYKNRSDESGTSFDSLFDKFVKGELPSYSFLFKRFR